MAADSPSFLVTEGSEVARYIGRHGTSRVSKAVLVDAVPPLVLKTEANPKFTPIAALDGLRNQEIENRAQFFKDWSIPFYGYNRPGAKISEGMRESFGLQAMSAGIVGVYECINQFSETDFTEDLKAMTIPTLVVHGDNGKSCQFRLQRYERSKSRQRQR